LVQGHNVVGALLKSAARLSPPGGRSTIVVPETARKRAPKRPKKAARKRIKKKK